MVYTGVSGVILLAKNPAFMREAPWDIEILGKSMLDWVKLAFSEDPVVVVEDDGSKITDLLRPHISNYEYTVVLYSDTPLISRKTVLEAVSFCRANKINVCRMTRGFVFNTAFLQSCDDLIAKNRYYFSEEEDFITASNYGQTALVTDILRNRIIRYHMDEGVYIVDPQTTVIEGDCVIGRGTKIEGNNRLEGKCLIGENVKLNSGNVINSCIIGQDCVCSSSRVELAVIGKGTTVGPFAYIRPECIIGENCRIGDFVELKKIRTGNGCKISHLAYVGDCVMGNRCNIGCGVVFCNYDGKIKHATTLGDDVFVGSNSNLIAPLDIGSGAYIAAGSTITESVSGGLAVARARQVNKPGWIKN